VLKKGFIDFLQAKSPDILCLQETKASEDQLPPEIRSAWGYHVYFASGEKKGYSGVAILSGRSPSRWPRGSASRSSTGRAGC
jgi:exodeoxyribonuclease-3